MADHPLDDFRAAVKHAANGDWESLSRNAFLRTCEISTPVPEHAATGHWARERAFFDRLESLCLGLIARPIQGPTPTEALIDACRFYAQAFMGEYVSAARLERRFSGADRQPVGSKAATFAEYVLKQIAEREPSFRSANGPELLILLSGPVSRDTFERSVRRALCRLFDAVNDQVLPSAHGKRTDVTSANAVGSLPLEPAELELWRRVATTVREPCARFELGRGQLPIEASMPRRGIVVGQKDQQPVDVLASLRQQVRLLISAPPGGGLTTLAARVATQLAEQDRARLTLCISLAKCPGDIVRNGLLRTFAHELWGSTQPRDTVLLEQLLAKLVQHDALNLVLDGWDEMQDDPRLVRDALAPFKRYVCFTHNSVGPVQPACDAHVALLPLSSSEIGQWLHNLLRSSEAPIDEKHLPPIFDVLARDAMADLNGSELLVLDISLKLLRVGRDRLPTAAVLWHWIERCLSNIPVAENGSMTERAGTRQWLGQLALWMLWGTPAVMKHRKELTVWQVPASSLEPPFSSHRAPSYLSVPLAYRQALAVRSGLLQEREAETYTFIAPCIQQMLAAEALAREPGFTSELTSPDNRRILRFTTWVCAQSQGHAAALQDVIGNYQHPREHTHLDWMLFLAELLAVFDTGHGQTAWANTTRELLEQKLLAVWLACAFAPEQVQLGRALARIGSQQALSYCILNLETAGDLLNIERIHLIRQLRWFCGKPAAGALAKVARDPANAEEVREEAVHALSLMPYSEVPSVLRELLQTADEPQRAWLLGILRASPSPVGRICVLDERDALVQASVDPVAMDLGDEDIAACLDELRSPDAQRRSDVARRLTQVRSLTHPALIERAMQIALHGTEPERNIAAGLLGRVPPGIAAPTCVDPILARSLLTTVQRETNLAQRWAAYMRVGPVND